MSFVPETRLGRLFGVDRGLYGITRFLPLEAAINRSDCTENILCKSNFFCGPLIYIKVTE